MSKHSCCYYVSAPGFYSAPIKSFDMAEAIALRKGVGAKVLRYSMLYGFTEIACIGGTGHRRSRVTGILPDGAADIPARKVRA